MASNQKPKTSQASRFAQRKRGASLIAEEAKMFDELARLRRQNYDKANFKAKPSDKP